MCKRVLVACLVLLAACNIVAGQNVSPELYKAAAIPDSLKTEAYSVVRYKMDETIIKGPGKYISRLHSIVTVLNEKAEDEAEVTLGYDKMSSINSFQMNVYDADGKVIKKYKKGDMYDRSAVDNVSIITDNRLKHISHTISSYPTTIEIIYETEDESSLGYGGWPLQYPEQSVQNSYCKVTVAPGAGFRYQNKNTTIKPVKTVVNGADSYTWEVKNLKGGKPEEGTPSWRFIPRIDFAADNFQYDGVAGDMSSWDNFGKWLQKLNGDVNTLPPARAEEIRQLVKDIKTDKEKAKFLYEYMQRNMRYVSIQLGIGGFKPFPASFVDQKKYGDCKALSNYMQAMLKAVGIPSNYAVINAGENAEPANPLFSQNRFNHAILCIPFKGDTTWLECTSTTKPFGSLGTFTENRNALIITDGGGKLVRTPRSKAASNAFNSEVLIKLDADGGAKTSIKIAGSGEYRDLYLDMASATADKQKEYMLRSMRIKPPVSFDFKPAEDKDGIKELNVELEYDKFCDVNAGNKQFYRPAAFSIWSFTCPALDKRKTDFYFDHPLQKQCITNIELPEGFEVETMPVSQNIKFAYGSYDVKFEYDAAKNKVISTAKFILTEHVIPAAKYTEMQQYMDAVAKAQNKKLVIRRKA